MKNWMLLESTWKRLLQFKAVDFNSTWKYKCYLIEKFNWNPDFTASRRWWVDGSLWEDGKMADEIYVIGWRIGTCWQAVGYLKGWLGGLGGCFQSYCLGAVYSRTLTFLWCTCVLISCVVWREKAFVCPHLVLIVKICFRDCSKSRNNWLSSCSTSTPGKKNNSWKKYFRFKLWCNLGFLCCCWPLWEPCWLPWHGSIRRTCSWLTSQLDVPARDCRFPTVECWSKLFGVEGALWSPSDTTAGRTGTGRVEPQQQQQLGLKEEEGGASTCIYLTKFSF